MKSPTAAAILTWIGTYLLAGVVSSVLEMMWTMNQAMDLDTLESSMTVGSMIFFAVAPLLVASWMSRRVYRARKAEADEAGSA